MKKATIYGLITAIILLCFPTMTMIKQYKLYNNLKQQVQQQSNYVQDLQNLKQAKLEYYKAVQSVANKFYTEGRIFTLWQTIQNYFKDSFISFYIENQYDTKGNIKFVVFDLTVAQDPVHFIQTLEKITPLLDIDSISYNSKYNSIKAVLRAPVISDNAGFVITKDLYKTNSYTVAKFVMATKDENLIPKGNYIVLYQKNMYYVGIPLVTHLDSLNAQAVASSYAKKGIITFIVGGE